MTGVPAEPPDVYLHVGPPKTGTTYLQDVLWQNQARLGELGVTVPGRQVDHFQAALDLRGISFGGFDDPTVPGAWARLVSRVREARRERYVSHFSHWDRTEVEELARLLHQLNRGMEQ